MGANNFTSFIDYVVGEKQPIEEIFGQPSIDTDGEVAAVAFDYIFKVSGETTNSGREMWQLVRSPGGWKINSIIYSISIPENPAAPTR